MTAGALIVAAGFSRRFGSDKRRYVIADGDPLLLATVKAYSEVFPNVAVVLRHDDGLRARAVRRLIAPPSGAAFAHEPPNRLRSMALLYWIPDGQRERLAFGLRYVGIRIRDAVAAARADG